VMTVELAADGVPVMGTVADWLSARLFAAPRACYRDRSSSFKSICVNDNNFPPVSASMGPSRTNRTRSNHRAWA
jgi:hypothetical protein